VKVGATGTGVAAGAVVVGVVGGVGDAPAAKTASNAASAVMKMN